jgi:hypothetical protein
MGLRKWTQNAELSNAAEKKDESASLSPEPAQKLFLNSLCHWETPDRIEPHTMLQFIRASLAWREGCLIDKRHRFVDGGGIKRCTSTNDASGERDNFNHLPNYVRHFDASLEEAISSRPSVQEAFEASNACWRSWQVSAVPQSWRMARTIRRARR